MGVMPARVSATREVDAAFDAFVVSRLNALVSYIKSLSPNAAASATAANSNTAANNKAAAKPAANSGSAAANKPAANRPAANSNK